MNTENLLYLTTAFQPTASHKKASFLDFFVYIGKRKPYHISLSRDCMGLGWLEIDRPFPAEGANITRMDMLSPQHDQIFANWFPVQLMITGRAGRHAALHSIVQTAINTARAESQVLCISRLAVFRQDSGALEYAWELIDGRDPSMVAEQIGDPGQLLTDEFSERGLLVPPVRTGASLRLWRKKPHTIVEEGDERLPGDDVPETVNPTT